MQFPTKWDFQNPHFKLNGENGGERLLFKYKRPGRNEQWYV